MKKLYYYVYAGDKFEVNINNIKHVLSIEQDSDSENPRNFGPLGTMLCWHRYYSLGDKHSYGDIYDALYDLCEQYDLDAESICAYKDDENTAKQRDRRIIEDLKEHVCIKFLYLYDHSGITISLDDFRDPWDSGIVGIIYMDKQTTLENFPNVDEINWYTIAEEHLRGEVREYDQWLTGDIYEFILEKVTTCPYCGNEETEIIDSMSGFYGNDILINGMLEYLPEEFKEYFKEVK